jgi:hypothetical protein
MSKPKSQPPINQTQVNKTQKELDKDDVKRLIFSNTEELADSAFSDKNLDKANEKFSLTEYRLHNPKIARVVGEIKAYRKKFPREFYRLIYKLNGWAITDTSLYNRPGVVGKWTNDLIYLRYPAGTLKYLQMQNPLVADGVRLHKHFQWLNVLGEELLDKFIQEAIDLMGKCSTWGEFVQRFAKDHGKPYQIDLFEEFK